MKNDKLSCASTMPHKVLHTSSVEPNTFICSVLSATHCCFAHTSTTSISVKRHFRGTFSFVFMSSTTKIRVQLFMRREKGRCHQHPDKEWRITRDDCMLGGEQEEALNTRERFRCEGRPGLLSSCRQQVKKLQNK